MSDQIRIETRWGTFQVFIPYYQGFWPLIAWGEWPSKSWRTHYNPIFYYLFIWPFGFRFLPKIQEWPYVP